VRIHAIQTGTVRIRVSQQEGVGRLTRRARPLLDRRWTDPLPILCWLIEHPEGPILVDTGETPRAMDPGYFPRWQDAVGVHLRALGIEPGALRTVVLTHLHTDHAGGLGDVALPGVEVLLTRRELADATGRLGPVLGYLPQRWPPGVRLQGMDFPDGPLGPFPASRRLTRAGDVLAIPTPGHTPGHCSVVVRDADRTVILAGDTSYTEALMDAGRVDGISPSAKVARATLARFGAWAHQERLVYLPAHDPAAARRLGAPDGAGATPGSTPAGS
jgi:glyoxylase-like metal-dependent hydrolase (beta-lactamase superfamily II)